MILLLVVAFVRAQTNCSACEGADCVVQERVRVEQLCADSLCVQGGPVPGGDNNPCTIDKIVDGVLVHTPVAECCAKKADCDQFQPDACFASECVFPDNSTAAGFCRHHRIHGCCLCDVGCPARTCFDVACEAAGVTPSSIWFTRRSGAAHLDILHKRDVSSASNVTKTCLYTPIADCCLASSDCTRNCTSNEFPICDGANQCQCVPSTQFQCTKNSDCAANATTPAGRHCKKRGDCVVPLCKKGWCEFGYDPTVDQDGDGFDCAHDCNDTNADVAVIVYCADDNSNTNFDGDRFLRCGVNVSAICANATEPNPCPDGQVPVNKTAVGKCDDNRDELCLKFECDCCDHNANDTAPDEKLCCMVDCNDNGLPLCPIANNTGCPCVVGPVIASDDDDGDDDGDWSKDWSERSSSSSQSSYWRRKRSTHERSHKPARPSNDQLCMDWAAVANEAPLDNVTIAGCFANATCCRFNPDPDVELSRKRGADDDPDNDQCDELCNGVETPKSDFNKTCILDCDQDGLSVCGAADTVAQCCERLLSNTVSEEQKFLDCCSAFLAALQTNSSAQPQDQPACQATPPAVPPIPILFDQCECPPTYIDNSTIQGSPAPPPPSRKRVAAVQVLDQCECTKEATNGNFTVLCHEDRDHDCVPGCKTVLICQHVYQPNDTERAWACKKRGLIYVPAGSPPECDCDDDNPHRSANVTCLKDQDHDGFPNCSPLTCKTFCGQCPDDFIPARPCTETRKRALDAVERLLGKRSPKWHDDDGGSDDDDGDDDDGRLYKRNVEHHDDDGDDDDGGLYGLDKRAAEGHDDDDDDGSDDDDSYELEKRGEPHRCRNCHNEESSSDSSSDSSSGGGSDSSDSSSSGGSDSSSSSSSSETESTRSSFKTRSSSRSKSHHQCEAPVFPPPAVACPTVQCLNQTGQCDCCDIDKYAFPHSPFCSATKDKCGNWDYNCDTLQTPFLYARDQTDSSSDYIVDLLRIIRNCSAPPLSPFFPEAVNDVVGGGTAACQNTSGYLLESPVLKRGLAGASAAIFSPKECNSVQTTIVTPALVAVGPPFTDVAFGACTSFVTGVASSGASPNIECAAESGVAVKLGQ